MTVAPDVATPLRQGGFQTIAMLSSYPYPPDFLDWMRQLWETDAGQDFIDALIDA